MIELTGKIRETNQYELPLKKTGSSEEYDIYPTHQIAKNSIFEGYDSLAKALAPLKTIKIDGYIGIRFEDVRENLSAAFEKIGIEPVWINVAKALKKEDEINEMLVPFLGADDPVFGKLCELELKDFFEQQKLKKLSETASNSTSLVIFYGIGSALVPAEGKNVFFEISKNEIQFRSRAGSISNLGSTQPTNPQEMYKRFYFVDWTVLNRHKKKICDRIHFLVDGQRSNSITWMTGDTWLKSISSVVREPIRVRPWFSPGAWGGSWIENKIEGLPEEVNYAWSFELIVPENGVIIESSGFMLEFSFDFLMFAGGEEILGRDFEEYRYEFPIRFDFLDTFEGGNLSIQCHPQKSYMKKHFGENITQEETYYILDRKEDAQVYLGFQEGVTAPEFRKALEKSVEESKELEITRYVQVFDSQKHGLYLIPPGTVHSSGKNNLVLEISSTPYIYTFKMYDWLRPDLNGKPRPLNIERGMDNLVFDRAGAKVEQELISKPVQLESNEHWTLEHLPTHKTHLYDVHRFTIKSSVKVKSFGKVHVLSLVEGDTVEVVTDHGSTVYSYAETFVIPAAVETYTLRNPGGKPIKVVKAFIK